MYDGWWRVEQQLRRRDDHWRGPDGCPRRRSPPQLPELAYCVKRARRQSSRSRTRDRHEGRETRETGRDVVRDTSHEGRQTYDASSVQETRHSPTAPSEDPVSPKVRIKLYKMGEFCCNIVANYVKGNENPEQLQPKLQIDQRTKIDHCRSHMERAGPLATVWHFSAADRRDCIVYDALCDYFVEKQRVGLVQTPTYYVYIVPPTEKYLKDLRLPTSNFVVGLQIPVKR